jgi:hypothetical protein
MIALVVVYGAYGKHPEESAARCRSRIVSDRIKIVDGQDDTKGRAQNLGRMFQANGHRLLLAEYCALCTMPTPQQDSGPKQYLKGGCRFIANLDDLSLSRPMRCVVSVLSSLVRSNKRRFKHTHTHSRK